MDIRKRSEEGVTVVTLSGRLDAFNLPDVTKEIDALIDAGEVRLVFNLGELESISSSPLGYLVQVTRRVRERGGELALSQPSRLFVAATETLGMDAIFKTFSNDDEAIAHVRG